MASVAGVGIYVPRCVLTAADLAAETGIPQEVLRTKFGIRQVHRAGPDEHVTAMGAAAARMALDDAAMTPNEVDLVLYCGSEYKEHIVWSAASHLAHLLGCTRAEAFEVYALCAGAPVALRTVRDMMLAGEIETALVIAASRESDLVDFRNERTRFMFNFGDGAGALALRRDGPNPVLGTAVITDATLSKDVVMEGGGSLSPEGRRRLDVPDLEGMRRRLEAVSGPNFLRAVRNALHRSGRERVDVLLPVHVKRSMHRWLLSELNEPRSVYLEEYGHMQAADQFVALWEARRQELLRQGDTVVLTAAGVGYTWAASVVSWDERRV